MYKFSPGTTSVTIYFHLRDSTTGLAKVGLTAASGGANASYTRQRGSTTPITLSALATETDAWSSGGFIQDNSTTAPGLYRIDIPDAACAAGVPFVVINLGFTGVIEEAALIRLETSTSNVGAGTIAHVVTVNDCDTGFPLSNAEVWVTTDLAGSNVVAGTLVTNAFGQVTFMLDAGSYYLWSSEPGFTISNPTAFTVS